MARSRKSQHHFYSSTFLTHSDWPPAITIAHTVSRSRLPYTRKCCVATHIRMLNNRLSLMLPRKARSRSKFLNKHGALTWNADKRSTIRSHLHHFIRHRLGLLRMPCSSVRPGRQHCRLPHARKQTLPTIRLRIHSIACLRLIQTHRNPSQSI